MIKNILMIIVGIYLAAMAIVDGRNKEIPVFPGMICFICVVAGQIAAGTPWKSWLPGILIGVMLYGISKGSRGSIGEGDALVYILTGALLGVVRNLELLLLSLLLCSVVSMGLLVIRHVGRRHKIAFVPFTAIAYGMVMLL